MVTMVRECRPFGKTFSIFYPNDTKVGWLVRPKVGVGEHFLHRYNKTSVKLSFTHLLTFNAQTAHQTCFVVNAVVIDRHFIIMAHQDKTIVMYQQS